jgi:SAM-dependent methyltransferase
MRQIVIDKFGPKDYWIVENLKYSEPSFRLFKCARMINQLAKGIECSLLDVGCGPGALRSVLAPNISYYGVDIAIHQPAEYLREVDIAHEKIAFDNMRFDFVTAMGFFEYMGGKQKVKFEEIRAVLKDDGKFILSYVNFDFYRRKIWPNYNNIQSITKMRKSLNEVFRVERCFPASHHWRQKQPGRYSLRALQMHVNYNIPLVSPLFAVEYFFVCSRKE